MNSNDIANIIIKKCKDKKSFITGVKKALYLSYTSDFDNTGSVKINGIKIHASPDQILEEYILYIYSKLKHEYVIPHENHSTFNTKFLSIIERSRNTKQ